MELTRRRAERLVSLVEEGGGEGESWMEEGKLEAHSKVEGRRRRELKLEEARPVGRLLEFLSRLSQITRKENSGIKTYISVPKSSGSGLESQKRAIKPRVI